MPKPKKDSPPTVGANAFCEIIIFNTVLCFILILAGIVVNSDADSKQATIETGLVNQVAEEWQTKPFTDIETVTSTS
jgi:hypothetical protein